MANGDTKTESYLRVAAEGTRADLPSDTCCNTKTQNLILGVANRIMDVEDEVEEMKNNPDVADIVATYADLEAYDKTKLTDKDVIRVLADETHSGDSTYYRYDKSADTFTYIGESKQYTDFVGTDGQTAGVAGLVPAPATTDAGKFLKADGTWSTAGGGGGGSITELTSADYNYHSSGDTDDGVALWKLASGVYSCKDGVKTYYDNNGNNSTQASVYIVTHEDNYPSVIRYGWASVQGDGAAGYIYGYSDNNGTLLGGANRVGAVVDMIYSDGVAKQHVAIGLGASSTKTDAIAIGTGAKAQGSNGSTAVGKNTTATGNYSTAIGVGGNVTRTYSIGIGGAVTTNNVTGAVALGYGSAATRTGEVNIGSSSTAQGFNSTNYRVIGGVHDGQDAHDAVTVEQVNGVIDAINTALNTNISHIGAQS